MSSQDQLDRWNERFAIAGVASIVAGNGGLPKVLITTQGASAEIYLHGAQLTSWRPAGFEEVIFLSGQSRWEEGKAIRGGIPVCFPWFRAKSDNPKAPAHGFVRTRTWRLESISQESDSVVVSLSTETDEESRQWWPFACRAVLKITIGATLRLDFSVNNTGADSFSFEEALHTYNRVGEAGSVRIAGLDGVSFLDNRKVNERKVQAGEVQLAGATDNAYLDTRSAVEILDPVLKRRIRLEKENSLTTVVWNPWSEDAAKLADLGDDEWEQFACVEASNILGSPVLLAPGEDHTMTAVIRVSQKTD